MHLYVVGTQTVRAFNCIAHVSVSLSVRQSVCLMILFITQL